MFASQTYINRRNRLKDQVGSGIILLHGNNDSPMNYAGNCYPFRQDSSFLYFAGLDLPGLAMIIDIDENRGRPAVADGFGRGDEGAADIGQIRARDLCGQHRAPGGDRAR